MIFAELNESHHATQPIRSRVLSILEDASAGPGAIARRKGDVPRAMVAAAKTHSATYFRQPCYVGRVWASLDRGGNPIGWRHRIATTVRLQLGDPAFEEEIRAVDGAADIPYAIPNILIEHVGAESPGLDTRSWNAAGLAENAFAVESFVDELAALARASPADYRRRMLADSPRALAVLELAVSRSDWDAPLARGTGRGLALQVTRRSFLAIVAGIEVFARGVRVNRVTCALELGPATDPRAARRQVEAGILMGLGSEAPIIEVHFTGGASEPEGVAESAAAAIAPAVANAVFTASGNRIRTLPIIATPKEVS